MFEPVDASGSGGGAALLELLRRGGSRWSQADDLAVEWLLHGRWRSPAGSSASTDLLTDTDLLEDADPPAPCLPLEAPAEWPESLQHTMNGGAPVSRSAPPSTVGPSPEGLRRELEAVRRELARERALCAGLRTDLTAARREIECLTRGSTDVAAGSVVEEMIEPVVAAEGAVQLTAPTTVPVAELVDRLSGALGGSGIHGGRSGGGAGLDGPGVAAVLSALVGDLAPEPVAGPHDAPIRLGRLDALSDDQVVSVVTAAHRLAAWAGAVQARASGELRERYACSFGGGDEGLWPAAVEVALATATTRQSAAALLDAARSVPARMPGLWRLWAAGRVDTAKVLLVAARTQLLDTATTEVVEAGLLGDDTLLAGLEDCPDVTPVEAATRPQVERLVDRLIAVADPDRAAERAAAARRERRVWFRRLPDGMGEMGVRTTAEQVEAMRTYLDSLTAAARDGADERPVAPGEADATRLGPDDGDPERRLPGAVRADVLHDVLAAAAAAAAAEVSAGAEATAAPDDTAPDDTAPDDTAPDDTAPDDTAPDDTGSGGRARPATTTAPAGGVTPEWLLRPVVAGRDVAAAVPGVTLTVPLSVLLALRDVPGGEVATLEGYGPVPGDLARELAAQICATATSGTWRCAIVDDRPGSSIHGTVLGLGRTTFTPAYRPTTMTRRFVHTRDGTCAFPGCRRTARDGELDHVVPHSAGGVTCECNLSALCTHHHRLKTRGAVRADRDPTTGDTTWTTPAGRTYRTWHEPR